MCCFFQLLLGEDGNDTILRKVIPKLEERNSTGGNEYFCNANRESILTLSLKTELHVSQSVFVILNNYSEHV